MTNKRTTLSLLASTLPPLIARKDIGRHYLCGIISSGYLANLNSEGKGPKFFKTGRKVIYLKKDLIAWLEVWLQIQEK